MSCGGSNSRSGQPLEVGSEVEVIAQDGLTLIVESLPGPATASATVAAPGVGAGPVTDKEGDAMGAGLVVFVIVVVLALTTFSTGFRVINEYERGVVFRLGRLIDVKGPGPRLIIPFGIDRLLKIDLRINVHQVPPQDIITKDNVTVRVTAVVFFRVVDARDAYVKVNDYRGSISTAARTTLRSILGQSTLDRPQPA